MKKYQIAIYVRLSKEDEKSKTEEMRSMEEVCSMEEAHSTEEVYPMEEIHSMESSSVTMQRFLLRRYAAENFSDYDLLEFSDDGYTGTNLDRPGLQAMLEMVKELKIDCIIVKDFSRFARDYIELGTYLEQIFPFMGVRFISVNDGYDSQGCHGGLGDFEVNFKNLLYDLYSKDLSQKVRSSLAVRKEQGQYVSANAPFGYKKDPSDRHRLLIEEDEAEIVRKIFSLKMDGYTSSRIARLFNETRVKTPIEYKIQKGKASRVPKGGRFLWSSSGICQILRNEVYIGNTVQKKTTKEFVGGKNRLNSPGNRLVTYECHEPIIDRETFDKVQEGGGKKRRSARKRRHPLTGKLVCGCCKKNLYYRIGSNPYFCCHNRYTNLLENCVHKVNGMFVEQYVLFMLTERLSTDGELERLYRESVRRLQAEMKEAQNFRLGITEVFQSESEAAESAETELKKLEDRIKQMEKEYFGLINARDIRSAGSRSVVLTEEMIDQYIEKIEVYDEENIEICWKERGKQILQ